jgi:hypothetical protein
MIKFLKVFLVANCVVAGLVSTIYVSGCFITWTIIPVWTVQDIHPQVVRVVEVCLALVSFLTSIDPDLEI